VSCRCAGGRSSVTLPLSCFADESGWVNFQAALVGRLSVHRWMGGFRAVPMCGRVVGASAPVRQWGENWAMLQH
jgi:hypothetical protein